MNVIHGIENYNFFSKSILTIGTYDGVHIGHQKIIQNLVRKAQDNNLKANLLTFFPHPRMILQKKSDIKLIDTMIEKEMLLKELGVDNLIIHPFSKEFSRLSSVEFTRDILVNKLGVSSLLIGYDHRFGKNREASINDLISYGKTYDFEVIIIPAQEISSTIISSTKIRAAINSGSFDKAKQFLGRDYEINGKVVRGDGLGRKIKFPTANINLEESYKLIPPKGVYLVIVEYNGKEYSGMMNIGNRPTINGNHQTLEVNIFNFTKSIYNEYLKVKFLKKIRDEKKFDSIESLRRQLLIDKEICKRKMSE